MASKSATWAINKAQGEVGLSKTSGVVTYGQESTFEVTENKSGGELSVTSSNPQYVEASIEGSTVTLNLKNVGSTTHVITVTSMETSNFTAASATYIVTLAKAKLSVPAVTNTNFIYDGNNHVPTIGTYDTSLITATNTAHADSGSYSVVFALKDTTKYQWDDGTTSNKTVEWTINKAAGSLSVSKSSVSFDEEGAQEVITVTRSGNGRITATTSNSDVVTVSVNESTGKVTVTAVDDGTATITVSCAEGTNYLAPANVQISVTCEIVRTMEDMSWEKIAQVIKAGNASKYLKVGDTKTITFPVQITLKSDRYIAANSSWKVVVLGINHNATFEGTNRVHFCIGEDTTGKKICFEERRMNATNTNVGGWNESEMKSWLNGDFYNALPSDLRNVITECIKWTDNIGGKSNIEGNVTATSQKIWLMSEFEVFGQRSYANTYEQNKQVQYDYYRNSAGTVRYSSWDSSTNSWWLRSPYYNNATQFVRVATGGNVYVNFDNDATDTLSVVPCFTIS